MSLPRFDFSRGTGVKLETLGKWMTINNRRRRSSSSTNSEADRLEAVLEPLHAAVFGCSGRHGERRLALARYCGFPGEQRAYMKARVSTWKGSQLKSFATFFGIPAVHSAVTIAEQVSAVMEFLECPQDAAIRQTDNHKGGSATAASLGSKGNSGATTPVVDQRPASPSGKKRPADRTSEETSEEPLHSLHRPESDLSQTVVPDIHSDSIRVEVYRRVLSMTPRKRRGLSLRGLRVSVAQHFGVEQESLRPFDVVMRDTAAECVLALSAAEERTLTGAATTVRLSEGAAETAEGESAAILVAKRPPRIGFAPAVATE